MNNSSFEQQLQKLDPPAPDPAARLQARNAALAEFSRLHASNQQAPGTGRWQLPRLWLGGLATACVLVIGVAIYWQIPEAERMPAAQPIEAEAVAAPPALLAPPVQSAPEPKVAKEAERLERRAAVPEAPVIPAVQVPPVLVQLEIPPPPAPPTPARLNQAQDESSELGQVTVTGTRIASIQPATVGTASALQEVVVTGSRSVGPAIFGPRWAAGDQFAHFEANSVKLAAEEPVSTFSVDVDTTSYSYARRMLNDGVLPVADAVRVEELINYFDYAWPTPASRQEPFRPTVTVSDSPWGKDRKLIHIGIKGYELAARSKPDTNLVLLLDVSGSMNAPDKLPLVKRSMKLLLDSLKPTDTVAIVVYAGAAGQVLAPTPVRDRMTIEQALDSLQPGGSTAGARGIQLAYELAARNFRKDGINRVLLATDGDFNVGTSTPDALQDLIERERDRGVYLSVLGFGQGNYRDDVAQTLAQHGNGVAAYIDTLSEARKVLVREASSSLFPIAGDVKIQVEFNPATVAEYRLIGYETRALNREDFNNDKVDAGDVGSGRAVTAIYEIAPAGSGASLIDERRYGNESGSSTSRGKASEYGFVKIRYKLPGESQSKLIEQPIRIDAGVPRALRQDVTFSTAVAGFGQLLRGGVHTGTLTWDDVIRAVRDSLGEDPFGYRAEFLQLAYRARDTASEARDPRRD